MKENTNFIIWRMLLNNMLGRPPFMSTEILGELCTVESQISQQSLSIFQKIPTNWKLLVYSCSRLCEETAIDWLEDSRTFLKIKNNFKT